MVLHSSLIAQQRSAGMAEESEPASELDLRREAAFLGALDSSQQYLEHQSQLSRELKSGFFALAQAKYAAGPGKIGQLQYPGVMRATLKAHPQQGNSSVPTSEHQAADQHSSSPEVCTASGQSGTDLPGQQAVLDPSTELQLGTAGFQGVLGELAQQFGCLTADSQVSASEERQTKDPLSWFGVMLPPSLREAQRHFQAAAAASLLLNKDRAQILVETSAYASLQTPESLDMK